LDLHSLRGALGALDAISQYLPHPHDRVGQQRVLMQVGGGGTDLGGHGMHQGEVGEISGLVLIGHRGKSLPRGLLQPGRCPPDTDVTPARKFLLHRGQIDALPQVSAVHSGRFS
jgi:hypothetical protein